jgi:arylsulfatase A-like enzyme
LAAPNNPLHGELRGVHLLDISPTLLDLGGHDRPESMQGTSLLEGQEVASVNRLSPGDDEEIIRRQLSGLGYI